MIGTAAGSAPSIPLLPSPVQSSAIQYCTCPAKPPWPFPHPFCDPPRTFVTRQAHLIPFCLPHLPSPYLSLLSSCPSSPERQNARERERERAESVFHPSIPVASAFEECFQLSNDLHLSSHGTLLLTSMCIQNSFARPFIRSLGLSVNERARDQPNEAGSLCV